MLLFVSTGEIRFPKYGEYFLGFAGNPVQARTDLCHAHEILKLVEQYYLNLTF